MTNLMIASEPNDASLVAASLQGNREAFGSIVRRYQSLICALAYNATGNLSQSEDLAQETFLAAWRQLPGLREPAKLRPWLCRIARNLSCDLLKREGREPVGAAESLDSVAESHAIEPTPMERTMSREEEAILWRSIEQLPEGCREPLILFYREHRSISSVAEALDLSEDAVKQRLSRGRKLLADQVMAFVEGALERTGPGPGFAGNVLVALPAMTSTVTGGAAVKAGGAGLKGLLAAVFPIFLGNYAGYRASLALASTEQERFYVRQFYQRLLAAVVGYSVLLSALVWWGSLEGRHHKQLLTSLVAGLSVAGAGTFLGLGLWSFRTGRRFAPTRATPVAWEYRSATAFFGLPLVHIRVGGAMRGKDCVVKAWIAAGGCAVGGLFAFGGMAVAPISIGGCALGIISWGGTGIGLLPVGGLAIGAWAIGGLALGWTSFGGCAVAWKAATGGVAASHDVMSGDATTNAFFRGATWFVSHSLWLNLVWVVPMVGWWALASRAKRRLLAVAFTTALFTLTASRPAIAGDAPAPTNSMPDRFDNLIRDDFFSGDPEKFKQAMKLCEDRLAKDPKYAPALAWKGSGDLALAGKAFQSNDIPEGMRLYEQGLKESDDAVAMRPGDLQVLIPRGSTYLGIAKYNPVPQVSRHLYETGVNDYEKVLQLQQPRFAQVSRHAKGELLSGLAYGYLELGNLEKSRAILERIKKECPDSAYSRRAEEWLAIKDVAILKKKGDAMSCIGCHE